MCGRLQGWGFSGRELFFALPPFVILGLDPRIGRGVERPVRQGLSDGRSDPRVRPVDDEIGRRTPVAKRGLRGGKRVWALFRNGDG